MITPQTNLLILLLFLLLDLVLTAAKIGFANSRLEKLADAQTRRKARAQARALLADRTRLVYSLQTGHVVLRFLLAGLVAIQYLVATGGDVSLSTLIVLLLAIGIIAAALEQAVEAFVLLNPEKYAVRLAGFARAFRLLAYPVISLPLLVARLLPVQPNRLFRVTEDELNRILDAGQREGVLEVEEREMINSIFLFKDTLVREIMIPRIDLLALNLKTPLLVAIDRMLESGYSRVPVYRDHIDNIAGVLYIKDLLRLYRDDQSPEDLTEVLRPAYFVPETKKVGELLTEMQNERNHIAIVVDEYGGVAGIATLEDIVEEIVGEIRDEYDEAEELLFQQIGEHEYLFQAKIDINAFNQVMGTDLPKESADTLGGLLYSWFGRIPRTGESTETDDILFTIEQVTGRRIRKVRAVRAAAEEQAVSS
ncbi:MAG TPA: hemolysin family protein [Anaerolineales bacterium]|nr:hemolysin family protein [Anaerolineales bacterium]